MADYGTYGSYRSSDKSNVAAALTFLLIGLGIGSALALLFAPKSGKQMRRSLRRKYEDARDRMDDWGEQAGEYVERGKEWAGGMREKVTPLARKFARD